MAESDSDDLISIIEDDDQDAVIPTTLPLLPVRDVVIFISSENRPGPTCIFLTAHRGRPGIFPPV